MGKKGKSYNLNFLINRFIAEYVSIGLSFQTQVAASLISTIFINEDLVAAFVQESINCD